VNRTAETAQGSLPNQRARGEFHELCRGCGWGSQAGCQLPGGVLLGSVSSSQWRKERRLRTPGGYWGATGWVMLGVFSNELVTAR
jgi:hypothetical protein